MTSISTTRNTHRPFALTSHIGTLRPCWPLLLRLIVGYGFMAHGYAKLSRGPDNFAVVLHALHVPLPLLAAWSTTVVELLGGVAILIGAFVPLVSVDQWRSNRKG